MNGGLSSKNRALADLVVAKVTAWRCRFNVPAASRIAAVMLALLAVLPVAYITVRVFEASRNIAFWDEFDSVLGFTLRLDAGLGWSDFVRQITALNSEHRTVTSRLLVALSYWLTGGVNFNFIGAIGNLCFIGLCSVLVCSVRGVERRVRLGVLLAFGLFHLELYEPFLWSGASIDHFQILLLAGGALAALARNTRAALLGAGLLAVLATFTLAHGAVVWLIGAVILGRGRRWRALAGWGLLAVLAFTVFLYEYRIDASHRFADFTLPGLGRLAQFWLALLGGPLTFGERSGAPVFGVVLLLLFGWLGVRGAWNRDPVVMPVALFAVGSLALVAFGRVSVAGPQIESRYLALGALAWTLAAYMVLEHRAESRRPYRLLAWCLPALVAFNLAANLHGGRRAETFLYSRDYPAIRFKLYGKEGKAGDFRLHPVEDRAEKILARTAARGIYDLPSFAEQKDLHLGRPSSRLITYVTNLTANERAVGFEGWAMISGRRSEPGEIHVVLRSARSEIVFSTMSVSRPDVALALKEPLWRYCGYNFAVSRSQLPDEDFQIGLLIADGDDSEYAMTDHWIRLAGPRLLAMGTARGP